MRTISIAFVTAAMSFTLAAQWVKHPTPGIPRTPDGKPNLTAPAPKTSAGKPDLSGLWMMNSGAYGGDVAQDLKPSEVQPWADALFKQRSEDLGREHMSVKCLPLGAGITIAGGMPKIIQTPNLIVMLYEDLTYRQIFMDGRQLETDPNPSWMGYSVGRWDGDTLVVESAGFNEQSWLDFGGHPHTEALRITERYRRRDFGHLDLEVTLQDPKVFSKPITVKMDGRLAADTEMIEYVCAENEKDRSHLVGKASDDKKLEVKVAPEILAKYAGTYEFRPPELPDVLVPITVTISGNSVILEMAGRGKFPPMIPVGESTFAGAGGFRIEFAKDGNGEVSHMLINIVEGELRANRRK